MVGGELRDLLEQVARGSLTPAAALEALGLEHGFDVLRGYDLSRPHGLAAADPANASAYAANATAYLAKLTALEADIATAEAHLNQLAAALEEASQAQAVDKKAEVVVARGAQRGAGGRVLPSRAD